jgi:hypothetical protein
MRNDPVVLAESLYSASDDERYELLARTAREPEGRGLLREACLLLATASAEADAAAPDSDQLALDLARGRVSRASVVGLEHLDELLASLGCVETPGEIAPASSSTRRELRKLTRPATSRRRRAAWYPLFGLAAAAAVLAVVLLGPAGEPWARSLELSRGRLLVMSEGFAADVEAAAEGRLAPSRFERPPEPSRRERAAIAEGRDVPRLTHPGWETIADGRPEFRWTVDDASGGFEVLLLDGGRNLLWSGETTGAQLEYPSDRPPLEPGRPYYWKVNRIGGDRLVASAYTRFQTLADETRRKLETDLRHAGQHAFLQGVAYDRHGLYAAAAEAFDRASGLEGQREIAERAAEAVRAKQGLAP